MKDVFEPLREMPEPPLRPSALVLRAAKRSARRRAATTALVVLALAGGGSLVARELPRHPVRETPAAQSATVTPTPAAQAPSLTVLASRSGPIAGALIRAVPPGYRAAPMSLEGLEIPAAAAYTVRTDARGGFRAVVAVRVRDQNRVGVVGVLYGTDLAAPKDPCATDLGLGIEGSTISGCRMVTVGGVPVRVVTAAGPGTGAVLSATRYLSGGYLVVTASQGIRAYQVAADGGDANTWYVATNPHNEPPLTGLPFTAESLAGLAAGPTLIP
ncbi:hypothetical protein [Hamadaea tsunoensis]|uniref:hypothetical protein n=1 Tax=Hamadaea tsunoensis TaxID=53368 RepID=UPI000404C506|nr:hypothetical protein [Hamadaea tsunoensis]